MGVGFAGRSAAGQRSYWRAGRRYCHLGTPVDDRGRDDKEFQKGMIHGEHIRIVAISYGAGILLNFLIELVLDYIAGRDAVLGEVAFGSVRVVSILTGLWLFYFNVGWRIPILKRILFRIDLNGTWYGKYVSHDYKDGSCNRGTIAIRIVQTYLGASLISQTRAFQNYSYSEEVKYDKKSKKHGIVYAYSQKENGLFDTGHRNGASELTLVFRSANREYWLEGDFWTIHGTKGSICVKRICKRHIDTFDEAKSVAEAGCMS